MATFVLVHGGWDGGWAWRPIAKQLQAAGHDVFTPTLTGSGERVHLASPNIDLNTHIQDVINVFLYEKLEHVTLVGTSYGGMIITGVAERLPERLDQVVYLDAFVPHSGESLNDIIGPELAAMFEQVANAYGEGWRVPHNPPNADRRTDLLLNVGRQALEVGNLETSRLKHTYVQFTKKSSDDFLKPLMERMADRARAHGWQYREMPLPHFPMLDQPHEVAQLLLGLV
jgi:pimeloyl-ACP methyl ester carboxylesterase